MVFGDSSKFAIESKITKAYERLSFRALGYFAIHIAGCRYGVIAPDATMLACSFDEVERRIARRGNHTAPFATEPDAGKIADAIREAIYDLQPVKDSALGIPHPDFEKILHSCHICWAPDGDEAFDDGCNVLQFDVGDRVRLIAYKLKSSGENFRHAPDTLQDLWLDANVFYGVLQSWRDAFEAEWRAASQTAESEDEAEIIRPSS